MILLDTSGLLAALFPDQRRHRECAQVLKEAEGPFLLSPFVLAEMDCLIGRLAGLECQAALLEEVAREAYRLESFGARDVERARQILLAFPDLAVGLADASIVVLAERYGVHRLLSLDERHFRLLPGPGGKPFRLLPADA